MTTGILFEQHINILSRRVFGECFFETIAEILKSKKLVAVQGVFFLLLLAVYLAALYASFMYGFAIENSLKDEQELAGLVRTNTILLQEKNTALAINGVSVLQSMEKISSLKYLRAENVAISGIQK